MEIDELMARLQALGLEPAGRRCLDFGCGVGCLSRALASYFARVDGIDIAASMVERARHFNRDLDACVFTVNAVPDLRLFEEEVFGKLISQLPEAWIPNDGTAPELSRHECSRVEAGEVRSDGATFLAHPSPL